MLVNYLKIAFRNLFRYKMISFINLAGLSIGIACGILLGLYVHFEYSFDRFHVNAKNIYRLTQERVSPGKQIHSPYVSPGFMHDLVEEFSTIEQMVQLGITAPVMLGNKNTYIVPAGTETYYANCKFFEVFTFPLLAGDPAFALAEPYSIVLSESLARRFFEDVDPVGKLLTFQVHGQEQQNLKITGIVEDVPDNSHLQFECLVSYATLKDINRNKQAWDTQFVTTYLMLLQDASAQQVENQLNDSMVRLSGDTQSETRKLHLQPLRDIHLYSSHLDSDRAIRENWQLVFLLCAIAVGIVLIACINYMNLSTARASDRAREIGVRKSFGARKIQLINQFLGESILLTIFATLLSLTLVELLLPAFNNFTGKTLSISYGKAWYVLLSFCIVVGLLSGSYPALNLSVFQPTQALKGKNNTGKQSQGFRKILVTTQFTVAILLFIATGIVYLQLHYIQDKDLGFQKTNILYTVIPSSAKNENDLFKFELLQNPHIAKVGRAVVRPLYNMSSYLPPKPTFAEVDDQMIRIDAGLRRMEVGYDFLEVFDMRLLAGRSFSRDFPTDATEAFILNEVAIRAVGWSGPEDALGKALHYDGRTGRIIGVLENFHFESLHSSILPFVLVYNIYSPMVFVKVLPGEMTAAIAHLKKTWEKYSTSKEPFHYQFMDTIYNQFYGPEAKLQTLLTYFAILAIIITCLGVLGLTSFMVEQRKKEIGVRKVLGATVAQISALLSKDFIMLVLVANVLAWPLAWYSMNRWLQNYAYRIDISWQIFAVAGSLALIIAVLIVITQAIRAALTNPIKVLKYE